MTEEVIKLVEHLCLKIEPYIPLPEKESHGDIDFLIIMKEGRTHEDLVNALKPETFSINKNDTSNTIYKKKQIDFCTVET